MFLEVAAADRRERVIKARAFGIEAHELLVCWRRQLAEGFAAKAVADAKAEVGIAGVLEPDGAAETNRSADIAVDTEAVANTEVAIDAGVLQIQKLLQIRSQE